jgi:hypothetical protein
MACDYEEVVENVKSQLNQICNEGIKNGSKYNKVLRTRFVAIMDIYNNLARPMYY